MPKTTLFPPVGRPKSHVRGNRSLLNAYDRIEDMFSLDFLSQYVG